MGDVDTARTNIFIYIFVGCIYRNAKKKIKNVRKLLKACQKYSATRHVLNDLVVVYMCENRV